MNQQNQRNRGFAGLVGFVGALKKGEMFFEGVSGRPLAFEAGVAAYCIRTSKDLDLARTGPFMACQVIHSETFLNP